MNFFYKLCIHQKVKTVLFSLILLVGITGLVIYGKPAVGRAAVQFGTVTPWFSQVYASYNGADTANNIGSPGQFQFCALAYHYDNTGGGGDSASCRVTLVGNQWTLNTQTHTDGDVKCQAVCYSATPVVAPTGTITEKATLDGNDWNSPPFAEIYDAPYGTNQTATLDLPQTFTNMQTGVYTIKTITSPPGVTLKNINGSSLPYSATLTAGGTMIVTYNFVTIPPPTGTIQIRATKDGQPWDSPAFATNYTGPSGTFTVSFNPPVDITNIPTGTYTINAVESPIVDTALSSIVPSSSQTLIAGKTITFTFNFVNAPTPRQKIYGIGSDNAIWRWNGDGSKDLSTQWTRITSGSIQGDFVLVNNSETDIYAYGLDNQIWHWNGSSWSQKSSGGQLQKRLWYANPNLIYGIGLDNQIWKWTGGSNFASVAPGGQIKDFVLLAETDIYAYGLDNQIWHWNGSRWSKISSGGQLQKRLWYANPNLIYGIGLDNQIWKWTGGSNFALVAPGGQASDDFVLANNSENNLFAIGMDNEIWHWDGLRWLHASSLGKLKQRLFINFVSAPTPAVLTSPSSSNPYLHPPTVSCVSGSPQVALSWSDSGASINHLGYTRDDYFLFRSPPGGNRPIDGINFGYDTSHNYRYTDTSVRSGTTYSYYLIAQRFTRDDVEISRRSNTIEATPVCIIIPDPAPDAGTACLAGYASSAQSLGGRTLSQPVVENFWSDDRLIIAVRGIDNGVYVKEWKQGLLQEWYFINGYTLDRPKLVVEQNQLWLYVKGVDGYVYKNRYTHPRTWSGWSATSVLNNSFGIAGPSAIATSWGTYWVDGLNPIVVNRCTANPPDLTAGSVSPTAATAGMAATFSATVSNAGTSSTGAGFTNLFQRATNASGTGATDIGTAQLSALSSGATMDVSLSYTFASSGTYYLRACADKSSSSGTGTILESNDNNNCGAWTAVTVAPATPPPTATLSASPGTIDNGASSTLTWSSTNATSCTAMGGFSTGGATSGSVAVTPSVTSNYQINCTGPGGGPVNSNIAAVTVVSVTVSISAAPTCISGGGSSRISWSATPAPQVATCNVSGPGLSSSQVSGSQTVNVTSRSTYVIACQTISGSTVTKSVIVDTSGCWSEF